LWITGSTERFRVRQDDHFTTPTSSQAASPRPLASTRALAWIWPASLALLVATTTLAVAYFGSVWFVPVYLLLMALILGVPGGKRDPAHASRDVLRQDAELDSRTMAGEEVTSNLASDRVDSGTTVTSSSLAVSVLDPESSGVGAATLPGKPSKKGRSRVRKPKATATAQATSEAVATLPDTAVTWVRVGPGKFVRADVPASSLEAAETPVVSDPLATIEPDPESAVATVAEDVGSETEGEREGLAGSGEVLNERFEEDHAPEIHDEASTEDNGIAPDAFEEPVREFPDVEVEQPQDVEPEPVPNAEPEPFAAAVTEPVFSTDASPSDSRSESLSSVVESAPSVAVTPSERRDRPGSVWTSVASWRGSKRSRVPAFATTVNASRVLPGNVRSIHPVRVKSGNRRSPRRSRGTGRSRPADRTHPPRSPPSRATL